MTLKEVNILPVYQSSYVSLSLVQRNDAQRGQYSLSLSVALCLSLSYNEMTLKEVIIRPIYQSSYVSLSLIQRNDAQRGQYSPSLSVVLCLSVSHTTK